MGLYILYIDKGCMPCEEPNSLMPGQSLHEVATELRVRRYKNLGRRRRDCRIRQETARCLDYSC